MKRDNTSGKVLCASLPWHLALLLLANSIILFLEKYYSFTDGLAKLLYPGLFLSSCLFSAAYLSKRVQLCATDKRRKQPRNSLFAYVPDLLLNIIATLSLTATFVTLCSLVMNVSLDVEEYISGLWWIGKLANTLSTNMSSSYLEAFLWAFALFCTEYVFVSAVLWLADRKRLLSFASLLPWLSFIIVQCLFILTFETFRGYMSFKDKAISDGIFWIAMFPYRLHSNPRNYCILFSRTISLYLLSLLVGSIVPTFPCIGLFHALLLNKGWEKLGNQDRFKELLDYQIRILFYFVPWFVLVVYTFTIDIYFDTKYLWKLWKQLERRHENWAHAIILFPFLYLLKQLFTSVSCQWIDQRDSYQEQTASIEQPRHVPEETSDKKDSTTAATPPTTTTSIVETVSPRTKASIEEWAKHCSEEEQFQVFKYMFHSKREELERCGGVPANIDLDLLYQRVSWVISL